MAFENEVGIEVEITTIQLAKSTRDMLARLKIVPGETYDELLNRLVEELGESANEIEKLGNDNIELTKEIKAMRLKYE